jgi:hypothetical protein
MENPLFFPIDVLIVENALEFAHIMHLLDLLTPLIAYLI